MLYHPNKKINKHRKHASKIFFLLLVISLGVLAWLIIWLINSRDSSPVVISDQQRSVQSANIRIHRNEYYQFQSFDDWVEVEDDYPEQRYVYIKRDGHLITQRLIVYLNRSARHRESDIKNTRVLPIDVQDNQISNIGKVSSHCNDSWPKGLKRNPDRIKHQEVSFVCAPSSKQYNIVVGQRGDDENIKFNLSNGQQVELTIVYSDFTVGPSPGDLYGIIQSFKLL